jgi:acyl carrier protein
MHSHLQVHDRVLKAIKTWDRFPQDRANKLTLDAHFAEDLSFDSLDLVEFVMVLEDEFDIEINEEVYHDLILYQNISIFLFAER